MHFSSQAQSPLGRFQVLAMVGIESDKARIARATVAPMTGVRCSRCWCGRRDSNPHSHRETDFLTTSAFAAAGRRSWSGLSLRHGLSAEGATRPVSTPSLSRGLGSGLAWGLSPLAFPDFERFYSADFPAGTPIEVCCVYRFRHVRIVIVVPQRAPSRDSGLSGPFRPLAPDWLLALVPLHLPSNLKSSQGFVFPNKMRHDEISPVSAEKSWRIQVS